MSNTPQVRFAGFTDAWEQRKVGETYNVTRGYVLAAPKTSPIKTDEMPYPVYSSQTKDEGLMGYYNEYLYENAITWTTDGANAGTVKYRAGKFYCTNVCGVLLSDKGYANKAAAEALNMIAWKWVSHVGNPKLMNNVMAEIEISLPPTLQEQDKISEFLESLDNLITLHQRKCDALQKFKKSMLQKMFPKNGSLYPEIRFAGFTDAWEQRKLSEIADKAVDNRGKTPTISEDGSHPLLEVASLGNGTPDYSKVTKYLSDETFETELRAYIKEGDILFSTVGSIGLVSLMDTNEDAAIAQNIVAFRANEKYDSKFLYAMLSTEDNQYKAQRIVMGAVQPSIKVSQLVDVEYCVTENIEEQCKLGEYFLNLDTLITLHQRKLETLKKLKKSLLQKMFV